MQSSEQKPRESNFTFGALIAALVMFLIAGALFAHALHTNRWLAQIKADAGLRAQLPGSDAAASGSSSASTTDLSMLSCPDSKPALIGFDEKGHAKCRAASTQSCPPGQYISMIDPVTLDVHCSEAGADLSCPATSYITEFMWLGENRVSFSCIARLNPFLAWKFEPALGSRGGD